MNRENPFKIISLILLIYGIGLSDVVVRGASGDDLDRATIIGRVSDPAGGAIVGARITLAGEESGGTMQVASDGTGRYRLVNLPPGSYRLRVEASGFEVAARGMLRVLAGQTLRQDFVLRPGRIVETITVASVDDDVRVDTARTVIGGTIGEELLRALPVESRNPLDLLFVLPGVAAPGLSDRELAEGDRVAVYRRTPEESGIFSLHGGTPFSNNLTIEGLDNNDDRAARERVTPSLAAVEEVQVVTNQFSAEYGRASGGRVNIRLRGGGERFHGEAFGYYRDARLNANGFFRNADPARARRLPFYEVAPGASLGGPIRTGRAFFFAAAEYGYTDDRAEIAALLPVGRQSRFALPAPNGELLGATALDKRGEIVTINGGSAVGLYDQSIRTPRRNLSIQNRDEYRVDGRHRLSVIATLALQSDERGFPGGRRMIETMRRTGRSSWSIGGSDEVTIGSRWFSSLRIQHSRLSPHDSTASRSPVVLIDIDDPRDVIGTSAPLSRTGRLVAGSSNTGGLDRREERWQIQESIVASLGAHTLRGGIDLQIIGSRYTDLTDTTGTFYFDTPADFLVGRVSRFIQRFRTESHLSNRYRGPFMQEEWRARTNLTLTIGLRHDDESVIQDHNNFGPRFSAVWSPGARGKGAIRIGYGRFFNRAMLRTLDDFLLTSQSLLLDTDEPRAAHLLPRLSFPAPLSPDDPEVAAASLRENAFLRRLERGFRIPESSQLAIGYERELRPGSKIELNLVFNRGSHLWRESNINAPIRPAEFDSLSTYLLSRDFPNPRDPVTGVRPITGAAQADIVRFSTSTKPSEALRENGLAVIAFGLASPSVSNSTNLIRAASSVLRALRPDPSLTQVEELQARGNSLYHGLSLELQQRLTQGGSLRISYSLSQTIDDGIVNTSSPLIPGDFNRERAPSLLDARHRVTLTGLWNLPRFARGLSLSAIFTATSSRPFNLGIAGNDRNLDDIANDRPGFSGNRAQIVWRHPGAPIDPAPSTAFSLPLVGSSGNLPRNAGRGPGTQSLSLRLTRSFTLGEKTRLELQAEALNPLNTTVFSFGAEYVDFTPADPTDLLVPTRTIRPRSLRLGLRFRF